MLLLRASSSFGATGVVDEWEFWKQVGWPPHFGFRLVRFRVGVAGSVDVVSLRRFSVQGWAFEVRLFLLGRDGICATFFWMDGWMGFPGMFLYGIPRTQPCRTRPPTRTRATVYHVKSTPSLSLSLAGRMSVIRFVVGGSLVNLWPRVVVVVASRSGMSSWVDGWLDGLSSRFTHSSSDRVVSCALPTWKSASRGFFSRASAPSLSLTTHT